MVVAAAVRQVPSGGMVLFFVLTLQAFSFFPLLSLHAQPSSPLFFFKGAQVLMTMTIIVPKKEKKKGKKCAGNKRGRGTMTRTDGEGASSIMVRSAGCTERGRSRRAVAAGWSVARGGGGRRGAHGDTQAGERVPGGPRHGRRRSPTLSSDLCLLSTYTRT